MLTGKLFKQTLALLVLITAAFSAQATVIYVADNVGAVGRWDTSTNTGSFVGSVSGQGLPVGQNIGIAWDGANNRIVLLDRSGNRVYGMDATTGNASLLFNTTTIFQGGALKGNLLFGVNENTQVLEAYNYLAGNLVTLSGTQSINHAHSTGIDPVTGQLIVWASGANAVLAMNDDGSIGSTLVTSAGGFIEDIDPYLGDYLSVSFSSTVGLINGTTGVRSTFLNSTQVASMGLGGPLSGVVVQSFAVPEPATIALMGLGLVGLGFSRKRKAA